MYLSIKFLNPSPAKPTTNWPTFLFLLFTNNLSVGRLYSLHVPNKTVRYKWNIGLCINFEKKIRTDVC